MSAFVYYQPNDKDKEDWYDDCVVRALTKIFNATWLQIFDALVVIARRKQCPLNSMPCYNELLVEHGFRYVELQSYLKEERRQSLYKPITLREFVRKYPKGTFFVELNRHCVAVKDGKYYDVWDSGAKQVYGYWKQMDSFLLKYTKGE